MNKISKNEYFSLLVQLQVLHGNKNVTKEEKDKAYGEILALIKPYVSKK